MSNIELPYDPESGVLLTGLDGANPLAFLAALGALRGLTIAWPERQVRLSWVARDAWCPRLHSVPGGLTEAEALDGLETFTRMRPGHRALGIGANLAFSTADLRPFMQAAADASSAPLEGRAEADFLCAFACESIQARGGHVQNTALRTLSGAGHQHFLRTMRDLADHANRDTLEKALFLPWTRSDQRFSLRWDPEDDRRYAHRWRDPSKDTPGTEWGANRLAFEGMPLFPVMPVGRSLVTTGFRGTRARDTFFTWPIWEPSLSLDTVRSLLAHHGLCGDSPDRAQLAALGVQEVFRSQRLNVGRYRSFSPSRSV